MANGVGRGSYPTELAPLLERLERAERRVAELERAKAAGAATISNGLIWTSPNGTNWQLGVTDGGATTWTAV